MDNKKEIAQFEINQSKIYADSSKYFSLFEKHIPRDLDDRSTILIYDINNVEVISRIIGLNPLAKYYIYGNEFVNDAINDAVSCIHNSIECFEYYNDELEIFRNLNMKFDCIIMNPPYQKNLHLKILAEAITHLKNDDSVCVNLSPVRWLQDPIALDKKNSDKKRFNDSICKHLLSIDIIKAKEANNMFNIQNFTDLAIYVANINNNNFDLEIIINDYLENKKTIFNKIYPYCRKHNFSDKIKFNLNGICVKFNCLFGGHNNPFTLVTKNHSHPYIDGKTEDGKTYAECAFKKKDVDENKQEQSTIKFDSIDEAKNFIESVQTNFFMFVNSLTKRDIHVSLIALPWMGEAINPRTKLKGYESEWTDEDFYQYFNITDDEKKIIEETMAKYTAA